MIFFLNNYNQHKNIFQESIILLIFMMLSLNAHTQDYIKDVSVLVNKTHAERTLILTPFYEKGIKDLDSVTVFSKIKELEILAKKNNDNELLLEAELIRVHYYYYRNHFEKEFVVKKIKNLDKKAKTKNILWLEARTQSLLANYFYNHHQDYGKGFEYFKRTVQLLENVSGEKFPLKQICLYQLAKVYYEFKEYENATKFLRIAKNTISELNSYYYDMNITNMLGHCYRELKIMDSSYFYFNKTLNEAVVEGDKVWEGISYGNLGYNYQIEGNYKKAKPLLTLDINIALERESWALASNALSDLATIAINENEIAKAQLYIDEAYRYAHKSNEYKRLAKTLPIKAKLAAYDSQPEMAAKFLDSAFIAKDSLASVFDTRKLIRARQRIEIEKQKLETEKYKQKQTTRIWVRNGVILLLVLLILIVLLLYNRYQLHIKYKEKILLSEKQLAVKNLKLATKRLEDFKTALVNKNKVIEQLEQTLVKTKKTKDYKQLATQGQLERTAIVTDKNWRDFVALFEQVHHGFLNRLRHAYPNLTPSETRFLTLSRLQLGTKEKALMLGVGTPAIRQIKSRLRKKIKLQKEETILDLMSKI